MTEVKCPHCSETIKLMVANDIQRDFGITQNMIQHAQSRGNFPDPWIRFNNRAVWLRSDIEEFDRWRKSRKIENATKQLTDTLSSLSDEDRVLMLAELQRQLTQDEEQEKETVPAKRVRKKAQEG